MKISPENELSAELERLRGIVDEHAEFVMRWLPDGTRTFVNKAYCRYFEAPAEDLLGTSFFPALTDAERSRLEARLAELTPEDPIANALHRAPRKDGSFTWLEWTDVALFDATGKLIEIQSVGRDVTAREEAIAALRRSEERYRGLFEQAIDAIIVAGLDGTIQYINPAGVGLLGFASVDEAIGSSLWSLLRDPMQRKDIVRTLSRGDGIQSSETPFLSQDGRELTVLVTAGVQHEHNAVRVILRDITQRRQLSQQLEHSQRLEAIGKLAGGIAHDFNNLLTAIGGNAELLAADFEPGSPRRVAVESIREASEKAVALTRQLLAYARRQNLMPEALDLNRIVQDTTAMLRRIVGEDVEILARLEPGLGTVKADPQQLKQVLVNLALNAREAMPQGGRLDLETSNIDAVVDRGEVLATGPYVRLRLGDNGSGIAAEHLERIFEPFFTTKVLGLGTGLGLATVYGIVRQSKGHITVQSIEGVGTTFDIYLPRVSAGNRPVITNEDGREQGAEGSTILLVEDEPSVRSFLREVLERYGFRVLDTGAPAEALEMYRAEADEISLVLSDVVMPRMNGFRMVDEMVKSMPPRVLFISGYSDEALARQGAPAVPYALLKKPFSPATLITKVREAMDCVAAS